MCFSSSNGLKNAFLKKKHLKICMVVKAELIAEGSFNKKTLKRNSSWKRTEKNGREGGKSQL